MNNSNDIEQQLYWKRLDQMGIEQEALTAVKSAVASNGKLCDDFVAGCRAVNADGELSAQGRANRLLAVSAKIEKLIDSTSKPALKTLSDIIAQHKAALTKAASGPDATVVLELRAAEIRREFEKHDPLMRPFEYHRINDAGNHEAARAIENAPGKPLITPEVAQEGQANRGARSMPERALALQAAEDAYDLLVQSTRSAKRNVSLALTADGVSVATNAIVVANEQVSAR
jgi:hypothetical protein